MPVQCFIHLTVNFEKYLILSIEKFPFYVLQHLIIHFSLHFLSSGHLWEVKNKG